MVNVPGFPSLSGRRMRALLERELGYSAVPRRGHGSHEILRAAGRPQLTWALSKRDLAPIEVRNILVKGVGLSIDEAREVVKRA
ncbi:hypothetical protein [Demequina silvatica]|uniref:hypothetical protein n=1 Tax=Demequina silvatica TaxID=1638988 RepID=UPI000785C7A8|nr:hypothetical protein [Demequina silvatica]